MPKIRTINKASPVGTSLIGYLTCSYDQVVSKYGLPIEVNDYKVDAEWIIEWEDGIIGTIYNYKNGKNYLGDDGDPVSKITHWNIGGKKNIVESRINNDIKNSWPILDEIRMEAQD